MGIVLDFTKECDRHSFLSCCHGRLNKSAHSVHKSIGGWCEEYCDNMKSVLSLKLLCVMIVTAALLTTMAECGSRRKRRKKEVENKAETTIVDFVRLLTLRLIYGLASLMGFQEGISNFMGGALVPPGVDYDYDYGGGDDDY